jgi:hypothetical protein
VTAPQVAGFTVGMNLVLILYWSVLDSQECRSKGDWHFSFGNPHGADVTTSDFLEANMNCFK